MSVTTKFISTIQRRWDKINGEISKQARESSHET